MQKGIFIFQKDRLERTKELWDLTQYAHWKRLRVSTHTVCGNDAIDRRLSTIIPDRICLRIATTRPITDKQPWSDWKRAVCLQPIGRWSIFPKEKKSDDPPSKELETRLFKYKGEIALLLSM